MARTTPTGRRKPDESRQRRNSSPDLVAIDGARAAFSPPPAPKKWLTPTKEAYAAYWDSPASAYLEPKSELPILMRMFDLLDEAERLERTGRKQTLVAGSTGQATLNPLLKHAQALREEARKDEAVLGRGPKRRLDLGIKVGEAAASLDALNQRLVDADEDADEDEEDPRFRVIDARSS